MDLLAISRDLVAADTVTHRGTEPAVQVLRPLFEQAGMEVVVQETSLGGAHHQNLVGTYRGAEPDGLVLVSHLDTLDSGPAELWTETDNDPYRLTRKDDRLYGLGTADAKLAAVCQLVAAREFKGHALARSLRLVGTFGAELSCEGARYFLQSPERRARFGVCSEPTGLRLVRAHKGFAVVRCEVILPDAPELSGPFERVRFAGPDALDRALAAVSGGAFLSLGTNVSASQGPAEGAVVRPVGPDGATGTEANPPDTRDARPTLAVASSLFALWRLLADRLEPRASTLFNGDTCQTHWTVARLAGPRAELVFEAHPLPGQDVDALTASFAQESERLGHAAHALVRTEVACRMPPLELSEASPLVGAAREACGAVGLDGTPQALPAMTEAGFFANAGIDILVFGPGPLAQNAHLVNEYNLLSQLEKAIELYRALISRLCV